jgi:sugar O-acyltransferase (sialic acid O-acetyltransferase NeuD family)
MKKKLIVIGDGGHARAIVDVALSSGEFEILAVVGRDEANQKAWQQFGIDWVNESEIQKYAISSAFGIVGLGQIKDPEPRVKAYELLVNLGVELATLVSPKAYVSKTSIIGKGTAVMHGAVVNAHAKIGVNTIINSMALVEHDATVGNHSHISTGAIVNGESRVGDKSFVGSGAVLKQGISVGSSCMVPMGSLVVSDWLDGTNSSESGR